MVTNLAKTPYNPGKQLYKKATDLYGEFTGLFKLEDRVLGEMLGEKTAPNNGEGGSGNGADHFNNAAHVDHAELGMKRGAGIHSTPARYVPDLLCRLCHHSNIPLVAVPIFGNRREIHSATDLNQVRFNRTTVPPQYTVAFKRSPRPLRDSYEG